MTDLTADDLATTPEDARTSRPRDMFFAFAGVNLAVTNLAAGALGIALGLGLTDVILVYLIAGAVGATTVASCVVQAKRTGASVLVNARPAFGYMATRILTGLFFVMTACWFGVNNFFGVTAARSMVEGLGGSGGRGVELILLVSILAVLVAIAIFGYRSILRYEKLTVIAMGIAVLTVAIGALANGVDWSYAGSVTGAQRVSAIIVLVTALGVGWAVSWTPYSHDFGRHLNHSSSEPASFGWAWLGMFLGSFTTFSLSAIIASEAGSTFDVGRTVEAALPGGVSTVVLLVMTVGLLPANLANLLVGPALLRTMDLNWNRATTVIVTAVAGLPIAIAGIYQPSFGTIFKGWMLTLVIVAAPWLVITLIDFFAIHRGTYRALDLTSRSGVGGDYFTPGIVAWVAGVAMAMAFASTPVFTSPLMSKYFAGADLSIFVGAVVAAVIYYPWAKRRKGTEAAQRSQELIESPAG